jgi:hypothetical protein
MAEINCPEQLFMVSVRPLFMAEINCPEQLFVVSLRPLFVAKMNCLQLLVSVRPVFLVEINCLELFLVSLRPLYSRPKPAVLSFSYVVFAALKVGQGYLCLSQR